MSSFMMFLLPLAAVALLMAPVIPVYTGTVTGRKARHAVVFNLCAFFGICLIAVILPLTGFASAADEVSAAAAASTASGLGYIAAAHGEEETPVEVSVADSSQKWAGYLGAGIVTGISGIGGGIAVAAAAPAAIGAFSEDAKNFGKALIFVALGEGVALYGLLISILILNKI